MSDLEAVVRWTAVVAFLGAAFAPVAWWLFGRSARMAERRERRPDVLDEGAAPAQVEALLDWLED